MPTRVNTKAKHTDFKTDHTVSKSTKFKVDPMNIEPTLQSLNCKTWTKVLLTFSFKRKMIMRSSVEDYKQNFIKKENRKN